MFSLYVLFVQATTAQIPFPISSIISFLSRTYDTHFFSVRNWIIGNLSLKLSPKLRNLQTSSWKNKKHGLNWLQMPKSPKFAKNFYETSKLGSLQKIKKPQSPLNQKVSYKKQRVSLFSASSCQKRGPISTFFAAAMY